jgi:hypothetical protein
MMAGSEVPSNPMNISANKFAPNNTLMPKKMPIIMGLDCTL